MTIPNLLQTPFDLTDAMIIGVNKDGDTARVLLELADRADVAVYFTGVTDIESDPNAGMHILGVTIEQKSGGAIYRFNNADEDNDGRLAIHASVAPTIARY